MEDVREIIYLSSDGEDDVAPVKENQDGLQKVAQQRGSARSKEFIPKRPEGMHRELYSLLCDEGGKRFGEFASLLPVDIPVGGYQKKLKIGARKVRPWKWTPFTNPGRKDGAVLHHWERATDAPREYPFAKFNKEPPVLQYSDAEYAAHLDNNGWTRAETEHLLDLCQRFGLRFTVVRDRWDFQEYGIKSIENLKERYYQIQNVINELRASPDSDPPIPYVYDADHERRRKVQLNMLLSRTPEEVEEEDFLRAEKKKNDARKQERHRKTEQLQKLIAAIDASSTRKPGTSSNLSAWRKKKHKGYRRAALFTARKKTQKSLQTIRRKNTTEAASGPAVFQGIKWPNFKTEGAFVRSQRMKLPASVGERKMKALQQILQGLNVDMAQIPTEEVVAHFNELRSDIVLLYELKLMSAACDMEVQPALDQYEDLYGLNLGIPAELLEDALSLVPPPETGGQESTAGVASSLAASLAMNDLDLSTKKRKAGLEQRNILKKLKSLTL